jgi:hypothetical protein
MSQQNPSESTKIFKLLFLTLVCDVFRVVQLPAAVVLLPALCYPLDIRLKHCINQRVHPEHSQAHVDQVEEEAHLLQRVGGKPEMFNLETEIILINCHFFR